ncbi:DoxX family protein [Fimbriiglobus ruber]|uniref:DoxX family protein n=1 Tax=Fimbriiglobus ruber TaxID=1908690 RepID=UPI000B4BD0AC|nr:DoxX family protein [Fimbriiglobus ruber]
MSISSAPQSGSSSVGLLLIRFAVGLGCIIHGWEKIHAPFAWMGSDTPEYVQGLVTLGEFGGGIAVLLGFLTRIGAFGIASVMVGAMVLIHIPAENPYIASPGHASFETVILYFSSAVLLVLAGPGAISVDEVVFHGKTG